MKKDLLQKLKEEIINEFRSQMWREFQAKFDAMMSKHNLVEALDKFLNTKGEEILSILLKNERTTDGTPEMW